MYRHFFALLILALCLDASAKGMSRSASRHRAASKTHSAPAKPVETQSKQAQQQAQPVQQSSSSSVMSTIGGAVVGTMVGNMVYDSLTKEEKPVEER